MLVDDRPSPRSELLYNINYKWKLAAIRMGKYKLVLGGSAEDRYDGWYEAIEAESSSPRFENPASQKTLYTECLAHKALWALGRNGKVSGLDDMLTVECGLRSKDVNASCKPKAKPCLFNLEKDPCEYRNIASAEKKVTYAFSETLSHC